MFLRQKKNSHPDVIYSEVVDFLSSEYPTDHIVSCQLGVDIRVMRALAQPAGEPPRETVELDVGVSLQWKIVKKQARA